VLQIAAPEKRKLSAGMFWIGVSIKEEPFAHDNDDGGDDDSCLF
jgi:hypothetical protein